MLNNRSSARAIPSWDTCIEALFKSHLPAKFAFTGRLSLHDVTQDGFYILRKHVCPFPALDDIFRLKCCPLEVIYVINCKQPPTNTLQDEIIFEETGFSMKKNDATKERFPPAKDMNAWLELKFGRLQYDPHLAEYVENFKRMLSATESKDALTAVERLTCLQYVRSRAKMLARFVARQMSGLDASGRCFHHQLEIHLKEIKRCLGTSVIPLGRLRVGSYLERALLFKAIADRVCLPAALVRGQYGASWIEVAIPQTEISSEESANENGRYCPEVATIASSDSPDIPDARSQHSREREKEEASVPRDRRLPAVYPVRLMRPNFIVDLMDVPGDLIPIDSPRSKLYRAAKLTCDQKLCCH